MDNKKMLYDTHERPSAGKWVILSLQHVFAMFGATILVPVLTGLPASVALFTSGVGTLIYILCTKAKVPIYLGSSFAYIGAIIAVSTTAPQTTSTDLYFGSVLTGLLVVGVVYVIVAVVIKLIGTKWIDKVLPPIIIGPMIAIIGFGLAGTAVANSGLVDGGNYKEILTALVAFLTVVLVALKGKGMIKIIPFIFGIVMGYIFASIFGLVDFSGVVATLKDPRIWFKIPDFMFLWFRDSQHTIVGGSVITFYKINFAAVLSIAPIALVTACEHIGDHAVLSEITGKDFLKDPGLHRTLIGDGIATSFAALVGGPANTSYGENTSVVGMTRVASVWVTGLAAVIAIFLSFTNIFVQLINSIPIAVMGGISLILYGFIGFNGIKILVEKKVDMKKTKNMIIASTMLVIGIGDAVVNLGVMNVYGMALAAIVGILLNLFLPEEKPEKPAAKKKGSK